MLWFCNERHYGKGSMDGVGGTVKNVVFRDAKYGKCTIKEFAEYADERVESTTTLYLPKCKLFVEPNEVAKESKVPQTLQVHKVIRHMSKYSISYLEFFFTQYYRKECDPKIKEWL